MKIKGLQQAEDIVGKYMKRFRYGTIQVIKYLAPLFSSNPSMIA